MARTRSTSRRPASLNRRTVIVWGVFLGAVATVAGLLALNDHAGLRTPGSGFLLTSIDVVGDRPSTESDPIFRIKSPLDRKRWTGIVIHHLGEPAGDAASVTRKHLSYGYKGLGYHFLIGNGNGMTDGAVHVGYRWDQQQPGAHVAGPQGTHHNQHSIGICLIGNGDRHAFTDSQVEQLVNLVQRLQRELRIPARNVLLDHELVHGTTSPGAFFPEARFRQQLLDVR